MKELIKLSIPTSGFETVSSLTAACARADSSAKSLSSLSLSQSFHAELRLSQAQKRAPWIGLLYGGQGDPYDFHKTGFNFCWMKYLLENMGFEGVQEYPHEPHFVPGFVDASLAKEPFGKYLSLNVVAFKPGS